MDCTFGGRLAISWRCVLCVQCALVVGVLVFAAVPAGALVTRSFEGGFGPDGTAASEFANPWSLALDRSAGEGQLYVASLDSFVRRFNAATHMPEPLPNVGFGLSPVSEQGSQLAVNSTTHVFYVVGPTLRAFQSDGEPATFSAGLGKERVKSARKRVVLRLTRMAISI